MASMIGKEIELEIKGQTYRVKIDSLSGDKASVTVNGKKIEVDIHSLEDAASPQAPAQAESPEQPTAKAPPPAAKPVQSTASSSSLCALMPGVVIKFLVEEGQQVSTGEIVLILEAMKMENEIRSDRTGKISKIHVGIGQQVQTGEPLISFE
jgi:glutaconyl-CoA/methylmalonyl-CoA decarboxylase subunit gamma